MSKNTRLFTMFNNPWLFPEEQEELEKQTNRQAQETLKRLEIENVQLSDMLTTD